MLITSVKNPKIKRVCALRERRERDREGVTVLEGYRELSRSMDAGIRLTELYHCPELYLGEHEGELIARAEAQGAEIYETNADALVKMAYRDRPEGLIALAPARSSPSRSPKPAAKRPWNGSGKTTSARSPQALTRTRPTPTST